MVDFNRGSTLNFFLSRQSPLIISFAGMQMTIVLTLGLENPHTIARIPWQTKKQPGGSITLTSYRCLYVSTRWTERVTTWVIPSLRIHRDSLSFIYGIRHISYSYFRYILATFADSNQRFNLILLRWYVISIYLLKTRRIELNSREFPLFLFFFFFPLPFRLLQRRDRESPLDIIIKRTFLIIAEPF